MKKVFLWLLLCCCAVATAQNDPIVEEPWVEEYLEERLEETSNQIEAQLQESTHPPSKVSFGSDIALLYESLDYSQPQKGFWENLLQIIKEILHNILVIDRNISGIEWVEKLQRIGYFLLIAAVIFWSIRLIAKHKGRWFFARNKSTAQTESAMVEEQLLEVDFAKLIGQLENTASPRQCLRMYYLWYLQSLARKGIIQWEVAKTNEAYAQEIHDTAQRSHFERLSELYSYIWYGNFALTESQYQAAKHDFMAHIQP